MTKLIHSMIRVSDLKASLAFYCQVLELEVKQQIEFKDFTLAYLANDESSFELELTHNHDSSEPYQLGNGYGHLAVSVGDLEQTHQRLVQQNIEVGDIKTFSHKEKHLATFFFIQDPDGYKVEFIQRQGRYQ
ncbi:VOC family protein [Vibrio tapetis]|uniref:Aldoketomutase n=1 Tax=Vibrio tapetis subsp. tapetis TaxID=1671868 RepID=A0A2N8ZDT9_9VIBR|nr:VOC family protein [Vibrio tapetis]SON50084.1 Lactoylglutathione lyase [Vibrio tapetis subsp. tapetis]